MKSLADRLSSVTVVSEQVKRTVRLIWQHPSIGISGSGELPMPLFFKCGHGPPDVR